MTADMSRRSKYPDNAFTFLFVHYFPETVLKP